METVKPAFARHVSPIERNLVETALQAGHFTTLTYALSLSSLDEVLRDKGPFTIFAPTDEAFRKLAPESLEALMHEPRKLKALLSYHVLRGAFRSRDLRQGEARTLEGTSLRLGATDDGHTVDYANITAKDTLCSNGVIHTIDTVLVPGHVREVSAAALEDSPWSGKKRVVVSRF
jgi:uncharacterized surface protein with fasciclin (FAS1) repeats